MTQIVRVIRHSYKGNGKTQEEDPLNGGPKDELSGRGRIECANAGRDLRVAFSRAGGSAHNRTQDTALTMLRAAGQEFGALSPDKRLGDENQVFVDFGVSGEDLTDAYIRTGSYLRALKEVLCPKKVDILVNGIRAVIQEALDGGGNVLLASHDPWIPLLVESITGAEVYVPELGYVDIARNEFGQLVVIDSNVDGVPLSKLA